MRAKVYTLVLICMFFLTACNSTDFSSISPTTFLLGEKETVENVVYYDSLTGYEISKTTYYCYMLCDTIKQWVPTCCKISCGVGILLLLLIRKSQKIKRVALFGFIVAIPVLMIGIGYYGIAFLIDYIIVPMIG